MKLTAYNPQVNLGVQQANVRFSPSAEAFGADTSGTQMLIQGLNKAAGVLDAIAEQNMVTDVTAANTEYNRRMNEIRNGLLKTQLAGARGIGTSYAEQEKQIRQEIRDKYNLHYARAVNAYNTMADRDMSGAMSMLDRHEYAEGEKNKEFVVANAVKNIAEASRGYYKDAAWRDNDIAKIKALAAANFGGRGTDFLDVYTQGKIGEYVMSKIEEANRANDYTAAKQLTMQYGKYLSSSQYNAYMNNAAAKERKTNISQTGHDIFKQFGTDISGAMAYIDGLNGYTVKGYAAGGNSSLRLSDYVATYTDGIPLDGFSKPFSSGLAGLAAEFEKAFPGEKLTLTSSTGGQHMEGSEHYVGNACDVASDSMDDDPKQREWVKANAERFGLYVYDEYENDSKYKSGPHLHIGLENEEVAMGGGIEEQDQLMQYTPEDRDAIKAEYRQQLAFYNAERKQNINNMFDNDRAIIRQMIKDNRTIQEIQNYGLSVTGNNIDASDAWDSAMKAEFGGQGRGGSGSSNKIDDDTMEYLRQEIASGSVTKPMLIQYLINKGITAESAQKPALKLLNDYNKCAGEWKINFANIIQRVSKKAGFNKDLEERYEPTIRMLAHDAYKQWMHEEKKKGHEVDLDESASIAETFIVDETAKSFKDSYQGKEGYKPKNSWSIFESKVDVGKAALRSAGYIFPPTYLGDDRYMVTRADGSKADYMSGEELMNIQEAFNNLEKGK